MGSPTCLSCPFCLDTDFDLVGLKSHLMRGDCDEYVRTTIPTRTHTPTPPAPADAKPKRVMLVGGLHNDPRVLEALMAGPDATMQPAPADDARCGCDRHGGGGACDTHAPRRAADASGAEAMREAWLIVRKDGISTGTVSIERGRMESHAAAWNRDEVAGFPFRVVPLYAAPLPARREDAVVEAARRVATLWNECDVDTFVLRMDAPMGVLYRALAALRGTRPEGHGGDRA